MLQLAARALNSARTVSTKFGPRLVLDCLASDGQEYAIWRPIDDETLPKIARNERISLGVDSKGKCHLLECLVDHTDVMDAKTMLAQLSTVEQKPMEGSYNGRSAEIADYIQRLGKLYKFSYQTAKQALDGEAVSPDDCRAVATSFFIQAIKHFDL